MIRNSFIFLPGITMEKEKAIWQQGILSWQQFIETKKVRGIHWSKKLLYDRLVDKARKNLYALNSPYFDEVLNPNDHWRLYEFFKDETVFLDIETTGLSPSYSDITVVGLYDGRNTKTMIKGINLDLRALKDELRNYKLIVTFNGSCFDIPFIEQKFPALVPKIPHFDLRFACKRVGLTGGLKRIEKDFGIQRSDIVGNLNGGDAVTLWRMYRATGDEHYLKLLVEYNEEDIVNLKTIADSVYSVLRRNCFRGIDDKSVNNYPHDFILKKENIQ